MPTPARPGRRRDGTADQGGAAGAGTSGRPWVLSRVHERGDQRMRKIVTGEQVARLSNPDPFALPVWRAPVYRTPAGFVILAQLARMLGHLVRLAWRHPLAAGILTLVAVIWLDLGWATLAALAAAVIAMLVIWRWSWPASFARWVTRPARG